MLEKIRQKKWFPWVLGISLVLLTLASRVCVSYFLANDDPGDGVVYARVAKNILDQNVYSSSEESPFQPTYFRMPGYPLFIAGVYAVFGHENNTAVRSVQAVIDTGTCVVVALLAFLWTGDEERKRKNALFAFLLASLCPFIVIYTATILTETLTTFLMAAMALTATIALTAASAKKCCLLWAATGVLAGAAVFLRPDAGLFAAGIGLTIVISGLFLDRDEAAKFSVKLFRVGWKGAVFSAAFLLVLSPWIVRNYRVFGVFQPISPAHGEMPGEFVPYGYDRWLRTWVDDFRFIEPTLWNLGEKPVRISIIPHQDFDSPEEKQRVAALLDQYNHPPGSENMDPPPAADEGDSVDNGDRGDDDASDSADDSPDEQSADQTPENPGDDGSDDDDENKKFVVKMTPEIDAGFAAIADERISRSPARYYIFLPAKRAAALWFDSHSLYYPFGGQLSPINDLDHDVSQQYWLPLFTSVMWIYTLLAFGGAIFLWRTRADQNMLLRLVLVVLMTVPRLIFFSTVENPEPRYVVELFAFTSVLGGLFLGKLRFRRAVTEEFPEPNPVPDRLLSLDVFRGFTVAAMVLVDEPGTWTAIYPQLAHATWNGATFADWIFPFFLFIVGVSIAFAFGKLKDESKAGLAIHLKIVKRAAILFALGILLEIFPFYNIWTAAWFEPSTLRIMGILQRIAICYLVTSLIFLHTNWKRQALIAIVILFAHWALMTLINVPGCMTAFINDKTCNLASYIDTTLLGVNHIWEQSKTLDPEGLLATLPAIASTLAGALAGSWLRSGRDGTRKFGGMLGSGVVLAGAGWLWSFWFPINKSLWTSSYVLYTTGLALCFLAISYWLVDLKEYRRWSVPLRIFGSNAIVLFVGATLVGKVLNFVEIPVNDELTVTLQERVFNAMFLPLAELHTASLLYAAAFLTLWLLILLPLYKKKIFLKI